MVANKLKVIGFGDNVVDRFVDQRKYYPGGNCVNFAVYSRELGVESSYLGVFGSDPEAAHIQEALKQEGVATDYCTEVDGETGWCDVKVVNGDRQFGAWSGGVVTQNPYQLTPESKEYVEQFDVVHMAPYAKVEQYLPTLRENAKRITFDLSDEPEQREKKYLESVVPYVDLVIASVADLSEEEVKRYAIQLHEIGAGMCLMTRGVKGSTLFDGTNFIDADAVLVEERDTMGAGDAFITSFTISLLRSGWSSGQKVTENELQDALRKAALFAAKQCSVDGSFGHAKEF